MHAFVDEIVTRNMCGLRFRYFDARLSVEEAPVRIEYRGQTKVRLTFVPERPDSILFRRGARWKKRWFKLLSSDDGIPCPVLKYYSDKGEAQHLGTKVHDQNFSTST